MDSETEIHVYFMPGMSANSLIFERIKLPQGFVSHFLEWIPPKKDEKIRNLIKGLINRQAKCVIRDPYANSFYKDLSKISAHNKDIPTPIAGVHEQKWEVDSLCYVIRLSYNYYKLTNDKSIFDDTWIKSSKLIYSKIYF